MSRLAIGVFAVGLFIFTIACGSDSGSQQQITATGVPATGSLETVEGQVVASLPTEALVATDAPEPTSEPTETPQVAKVGDRVEHDGAVLTVVRFGTQEQLGEFQKPKEGNVYILIEVVIENVGADTISYGPFHFNLKDGDGYEYNAAMLLEDQALKSGELANGDKARGTIAFETPATVKDLVLSYKSALFGSGAEIKVSLQ